MISYQDKAESFQEAESALSSMSDFVRKERGRNSDNFDFYKDIAKPYLGSLKSNLEQRFPSMEIIEAFGIFDQQHSKEHDLYEKRMQKLHSLLSFIENDETIFLGITLAENEWLVISNEFIAHHNDGKGNSCQFEMVRIFNKELYPMLVKLDKFGMILPVNTAACERHFNPLKLIKADLRNRLNQNTLDNLMLIAMEGSAPEDFSYEEALKHWSKQGKRRILNAPHI